MAIRLHINCQICRKDISIVMYFLVFLLAWKAVPTFSFWPEESSGRREIRGERLGLLRAQTYMGLILSHYGLKGPILESWLGQTRTINWPQVIHMTHRFTWFDKLAYIYKAMGLSLYRNWATHYKNFKSSNIQLTLSLYWSQFYFYICPMWWFGTMRERALIISHSESRVTDYINI